MYILYVYILFSKPNVSSFKDEWTSGVQTTCVGWFIVFYATLNNISVILWRLYIVLLVVETRIPGENHRSVANH